MVTNNFILKREEGSLKYLVVCDGGNVRSHAIATTLKLNYGREAIAVGRLFVSPDTMALLCFWADRIIITQPAMMSSIPLDYIAKVVGIDIGPDIWGVTIHPELNELSNQIADYIVALEPKPAANPTGIFNAVSVEREAGEPAI